MTQKRPVPSFVVFGSLTDRRIWRVCSTSPGRTGSWNTIVLSVITASGSPNVSFRSKWTWSGSADLGAAGRPAVRAEPDREHRRRRDRPAGDLGRDLVVPEQRVAVLDRRAARPDVAALDRELARLLVLHLPDGVEHATCGIVGLAHATTPSSSSAATSVSSKPAPRSSSPVSVTVPGRTSTGGRCRGPSRRAPGRAGGTRRARASCASENVVARREVRVVDDLGHRRDRATRTCSAGPSSATQSSRSRVANAARKSARIWSCTASSFWCSIHCSQPSARQRLAKNCGSIAPTASHSPSRHG